MPFVLEFYVVARNGETIAMTRSLLDGSSNTCVAALVLPFEAISARALTFP
jgi:hypothetical protein